MKTQTLNQKLAQEIQKVDTRINKIFKEIATEITQPNVPNYIIECAEKLTKNDPQKSQQTGLYKALQTHYEVTK